MTAFIYYESREKGLYLTVAVNTSVAEAMRRINDARATGTLILFTGQGASQTRVGVDPTRVAFIEGYE